MNGVDDDDDCDGFSVAFLIPLSYAALRIRFNWIVVLHRPLLFALDSPRFVLSRVCTQLR